MLYRSTRYLLWSQQWGQ